MRTYLFTIKPTGDKDVLDVVKLDDDQEEVGLDLLCEHTNSRLVDVIVFDVDGVRYDMWVDDEGLLTGRYLSLAAAALTGRDAVAGDVVICRSDGQGRSIPLTAEDVERLHDQVLNRMLALTLEAIDAMRGSPA
ncbi:MAG: hypothetical protein R3324_15300 [Halobacteriales archaeon]|nr:hypothetical protein [Halobacteriales archaeon]